MLARRRPYVALQVRRAALRALSSVVALSHFDVIVVGGGHAGCEAATAASKTGASLYCVNVVKVYNYNNTNILHYCDFVYANAIQAPKLRW